MDTVSALSVVYSYTNKYEKLGPVLTEARDITRARWGPDCELAADANRSLAALSHCSYGPASGKPKTASASFLFAKEKPNDWRRYHCSCLLGQALFNEKKSAKLSHSDRRIQRHERRAKPLETQKTAQMRLTIDLLSRAYADAGDATERSGGALIRRFRLSGRSSRNAAGPKVR